MGVFKIIFAAFATTASAFNPGATASIDFPVLQEAKTNYFDFVLNLINQVEIPNISFGDGHLNRNQFHVAESSNNFQFGAGKTNSVVIKASDLSATFHSSDLEYKILFLKAEGSVDAKISQMSVSVELEIGTQKLSNGKTVPNVKVLGSSVDLPTDHIDLSIHGNFVSQIADLVKGLFMGTVRDQITDNVNKALRDSVPPALNSLIADQKGETQIYNHMDLDWSINSQPVINSQTLSFGIKGLFFPENQGEVAPPVAVPAMPFKDSSSKSQFQAFASTYLLDSLASSFFKLNDFSIWTNHDVVPASSPIQLNTTVLDLFFPGIKAKYGDGKYVDVSYDIRSLTNLTVQEGNGEMAFNADVGVKFWVETTAGKVLALDVTLEKLYFQFTAIIEGMAVRPSVQSASLQDIKVESSTFGAVNMTLLEGLLKQGLDEGRVPFNNFISNQSLVIPHKIFGLFELEDLTLKYHDGYIEAGLTPHFLPIPSNKPAYEQPVYDYSMYSQLVIVPAKGEVTVINQNSDQFLQ